VPGNGSWNCSRRGGQGADDRRLFLLLFPLQLRRPTPNHPYLKRSRFRAIDFVFGHLLSRRLERFDDPFPDTVNI
jgi:hypothetical protein